jgi:hypothetical protein
VGLIIFWLACRFAPIKWREAAKNSHAVCGQQLQAFQLSDKIFALIFLPQKALVFLSAKHFSSSFLPSDGSAAIR